MKTKKITAVIFFLSGFLFYLYGTAYSVGISIPLPFKPGTLPAEPFPVYRVHVQARKPHSLPKTLSQELALQYEIMRAVSTSS